MLARIFTNDNMFSMFLLFVCVVAWRALENASYMGSIFPRTVVILLAFFTLINLFQGLKKPEFVEIFVGEKKHYIFVMLLGMVVYVWAIPRIGFLLSSVSFMAIFFWLLGDDRNIKNAIKSIIFAAVLGTVLYFIFVTVFNVPLPRSPWGFENYILRLRFW